MGRENRRRDYQIISSTSPGVVTKPALLTSDNMNISSFPRECEIKFELANGPLIKLAVNGLKNMFDKDRGLFCYRIRKTHDGVVKEGYSARYTIISLLGLHRYEIECGQSPIDVKATLAAFLQTGDNIDNIGDLGLLIWLSALALPEQLNHIFSYFHIKQVLNKYRDARQGKTTELAWFLAGLSHSALVSEDNTKDLQDLASQTFKLIKRNYGGRGIFGHSNKGTFSGLIRGTIGCFADQVYPIYALAMFAKAYGNKDALKMALDCGQAICRLQGPFGQWWWHYDAVTGKIIGKYPVYSVHQDGMAPMALFTLSKISGVQFAKHIYRGLEWIIGNNELSFTLVDVSQNVIWRSFYRKKHEMWFEEALSISGANNKGKNYDDLMILFECRPYHLGWLLYAFADKLTEKIDFKSQNVNMVQVHKIRYAIITPARDEALYIDKTIQSVISQTIKPVEWVIVNDGSSDKTGEIIDRYTSSHDWIKTIHRADRGFRKSGAGVIEAFYDGYGTLRSTDRDFVVKLDGDLSFVPQYFERCFERFQANPKLGIAGGTIFHLIDGALKPEKNPQFHVRGATKIYRKDCWDAIGGLIKAPGWDAVDEIKANMLGWQTQTFLDLALIHYRYTGKLDGTWGGYVKNGMADYVAGYHPLFMLAKFLRRLVKKPYAIGSLALLYGFLSGYMRRVPQVNDEDLIAYIREQQMRRLTFRSSIWK